MFTNFKTSATKLLLDPQNCTPLTPKKGEKFDIILSPSLYWVRSVKLPISSLREVKKLLPSLFEDFLPEGNYSYSAYKEGEKFLIFAYEDKEILSLLQHYNIQPSQINSVAFAQDTLKRCDFPMRLNEAQLLTLQDDIVVIIPKEWEKKSYPLDVTRITKSQHTITLQQFGHIVDSANLYKIIALLAAFAVVLGVELFAVHHKTQALQTDKQKLFAKYHLKPTMMQNKAILSNYTNLYKGQKKLRATIDIFLALPLSKTQHLSLLEYNTTHFMMEIANIQPQSRKKIETFLKNKGLKIATTLTKNILKVEVML